MWCYMPVITAYDRKNMTVRLTWATEWDSVPVNKTQLTINGKKWEKEKKKGQMRKQENKGERRYGEREEEE